MTDDEERSAGQEAVDQLVETGLLDELMSRVDAGEVQLTGEGGFLPAMIKAVLERGLQAELTDHVGYEKGDPAGRGSGNSRNGSTPKTVATEVGDVELETPRDRSGSFEPRLVPKGSRRVGGLDGMIISLYAGGMTVRGTQAHLVAAVAGQAATSRCNRGCRPLSGGTGHRAPGGRRVAVGERAPLPRSSGPRGGRSGRGCS